MKALVVTIWILHEQQPVLKLKTWLRKITKVIKQYLPIKKGPFFNPK